MLCTGGVRSKSEGRGVHQQQQGRRTSHSRGRGGAALEAAWAAASACRPNAAPETAAALKHSGCKPAGAGTRRASTAAGPGPERHGPAQSWTGAAVCSLPAVTGCASDTREAAAWRAACSRLACCAGGRRTQWSLHGGVGECASYHAEKAARPILPSCREEDGAHEWLACAYGAGSNKRRKAVQR